MADIPGASPKQVAIFMSDFHLGQKDRMEEFHADREFAELLYRLSIENAAENNDVDLVLLGDVMDLWTTIIDPNEVNAATVADVELYFCPDRRKDAIKNEKDTVDRVLQAHPLFFEALATFLIDDLPHQRRIIYVPGNHDHSVVHPDIHVRIRDHILTECHKVSRQYSQELIHNHQNALQELPKRILFWNYYLDFDLQVYAEHGNQLTYGGAYRYELPPLEAWKNSELPARTECIDEQFGAECPGYFELKLVWNRLERKAPELDNVFMGALSPAMWPGLFWWLLIGCNFRFFNTLRAFQAQYKHYSELIATRRPNSEAIIAIANAARISMPVPLKSVIHLWRARYHQTRDEFWHTVPSMFQRAEAPFCGSRLDPLRIKTIILGHSHHAKDEALSFEGAEGVRYYNSGSWIQHYENGRSLVEETWVTVSRVKPVPGMQQENRIIDRRLNRRKVEIPLSLSSPVAPEGTTMNPVLRDMNDVRVGDVLLIRANYGAMIRRLIKTGRFRELVRSIPGMISGWMNRFGTFSSWNHVALVYGSPFEPEEERYYNDVLIIEAVPDAGVAIRGPQHYLEHPNEHDIAVLRPKARWIENWTHRSLLRKLALSRLESHYDLSVIARQSIAHSIQSMDRQGRSGIAGLAKGAAFGIATGIVVLPLYGYGLLFGDPVGLGKIPSEWITTAGALAAKLQWDALPVDDTILKLGVYSALLVFSIIATGAVYSLLRVIAMTWLYAWAAAGAFIGLLIIPVMAELSGGWQKMTSTERWLFSCAWIMFIAAGLGAGALLAQVSSTVMAKPQEGERFNTLITLGVLASAILITTLGRPITFAANWLLVKPLSFLGSRSKTIARNILNRLGLSTGEKDSEFQRVSKRFICSGLAQDTLERTAIFIGADPGEVRVYSPEHHERWSDTLPKHFAASDKFIWVYLLLNGQVTHRPERSLIAEANPDRLLQQPRELLHSSAWSLRLSLIALFLVLAFHYTAPVEHKPIMVFWAGVLSLLLALWLARQTRIRLALEPERYRGRALVWWGQRIALIALAFGVVEVGLSWTSWAGSLQAFAMGVTFLAANALVLF